MSLSRNEIKSRAVTFSNEWKDTFNENADAKPFLDDFFNVFGITRRKQATFEPEPAQACGLFRNKLASASGHRLKEEVTGDTPAPAEAFEIKHLQL